EAFGVKAALGTNRAELTETLRAHLPPGWRPCPASDVEHRFAVIVDDTGTCTVNIDDEPVSEALELELALVVLDTQLQLHLGVSAPDPVFVHAGVVAHQGSAIVLPGASFAGKTTLVATLVDAGATYYSDEFAVIDERGLVHPYAKALSIRAEGEGIATDH